MRHLLIKMGFFGLLAISMTVHAQAVKATTQPQSVPNAQSTSETPPESKEVALLRSQLADAKDFHASILDTVYWALGGTFVLAGLLLGFGWLANFKVYQRDKSALKSELEAGLVTKLGEMDSSIESRLADLPNLVATATKEAVARSENTIKSSLSKLSDKMFRIELGHLKDNMEANPRPSLALTDALKLFGLCANKAPDELPDIMHFMLKKIGEGGKLTANEITRLNEFLDALPTHYRTLTDKLRSQLEASDIF